MHLHYREQEIGTTQYVDFMTLYPYVCKYFKFRVSHQITHVGDPCNDKEACLRMEDLIKCSIVPPRWLCHPVLLFRCNKKLMFWLCWSCVLTAASGECEHTEEEDQAMTGTWVMHEVRLAVEK